MRSRAHGVLIAALLVMAGGSGYSREFHDNDEWLRFMHNLASKSYPDISHELALPEGYTLAFVMKDYDTVLKHTALALHEAEGTPLPETAARIFPDAGIDPKVPMEQGSMCVKEDPGKHGRYCVMYVVLPSGDLSH